MDAKARKRVETLIWQKTNKDFRGTFEGARTVLMLVPQQGTCLVTLAGMSEDDLLKLARSHGWGGCCPSCNPRPYPLGNAKAENPGICYVHGRQLRPLSDFTAAEVVA